MFKLLRYIPLFVGLVAAQGMLDTTAYCSVTWNCLQHHIPHCTEKQKQAQKGITYNQEFCAPVLNNLQRGVNPNSIASLQINSYLGKRQRVNYDVSGRLPINKAMMDYLMDNMPFTAHLINAYQETNYTLNYTFGNKWYFHGDNGGNLKGQFNWILADSSGVDGLNLFWGKGTAKVLMWKLWGMAMMTLDYRQVEQNHLDYDLRATVFPANGILNTIMEMNMFRNVVLSKIREIVNHIEKSARLYGQGEREQIANYEPFKSNSILIRQLAEFNQVVENSQYKPPSLDK
ncbi:MAG: hypothetical protein GX801_04265 [Fibrobacter sp.]|nr:hypothetical protein [Fibrobacter sp.]